MTRQLTRALAVTALAAVAACSGGGSTPPTAASNGTGGSATSSSTGRATLTFTRLARTAATAAAASSKRAVKEFSAGANSLIIDATQSGATPTHQVFDISGAAIGNGITCANDVSSEYEHCTLQALLPLGNDTLTVATNSARDGSGTTLGSATLSVTILNAQDNPIAVTLDGQVASMRLFVSDPSPVVGTAVALPLTIQLYDATGTVLIAPQNYTSPVTVTDNETTSATTLYTQATQNSTQRYNGTNPVNTSPSAFAKTVTVPDRYTVPYLSYNGSTVAAFTVSAAFGTLSASVTVSPASASPRPTRAGTKHSLGSTAKAYDPVFDASGGLWVTQTGGQFGKIDTGTWSVSAAYVLPGGGTRSLRAPVLGPDPGPYGDFYMSSGTVSNGATTAPFYVTRFDVASHTFTDIASLSDQPLHLTVANGSIVGVERNTSKVWTLPFSGGAPGTPFEFPVAAPPVTDTTPALMPLPTRAFPSGDGNLFIVYTSYLSVNGTWLAKYSPTGTLVSPPQLVDPTHPTAALDAQAIDGTGSIWFVNVLNGNEFVRDDTSTNTITTYAVPRLFGDNSFSEITAYSALDTNGNLYFISYLTSQLGRVDKATGRVDLFNGASGTLYGMIVVGPAGAGYIAGYDTGPFIETF